MRAAALPISVALGMASATAWPACTHTDFLRDLAVRESGLNPNATNRYGYIGLFQMG